MKLNIILLLSLFLFASCEEGCQGLIKNFEKNAFNKKCLDGNYTEGMTVPDGNSGSGTTGGGGSTGGGSGSDTLSISNISNISWQQDINLTNISFEINDSANQVNCPDISASSSDLNIIKSNNITITGSAASCILSATVEQGVTGNVNITLTASRDSLTATETFTVSVFNPWQSITTTGAPAARGRHHTLWTGTKMIIWGGRNSGGYLRSGGMYDPSTDTWEAISTTGAPPQTSLLGSAMVWTGSRAIFIGGASDASGNNASDQVYSFNPTTNTWTYSATLPQKRFNHSATFIGDKIFVWGGSVCTPACSNTNSGLVLSVTGSNLGSYSATNSPPVLTSHTARWTGEEIIIWGTGASVSPGGGKYNPLTNSWTSITTVNSSSVTINNPNNQGPYEYGDGIFMSWDGTQWGGATSGRKKYDPELNQWSDLATTNGPLISFYYSNTYTDKKFLLWGGSSGSGPVKRGGIYDSENNIWIRTNESTAPIARYYHSAVWTGQEVIIWGGELNPGETNTGAKYTFQ